jgi:hypothetical protein
MVTPLDGHRSRIGADEHDVVVRVLVGFEGTPRTGRNRHRSPRFDGVATADRKS